MATRIDLKKDDYTATPACNYLLTAPQKDSGLVHSFICALFNSRIAIPHGLFNSVQIRFFVVNSLFHHKDHMHLCQFLLAASSRLVDPRLLFRRPWTPGSRKHSSIPLSFSTPSSVSPW